MTVALVLSERFTSALDEARRVHAGDTRKGSDVPYLSHLLAVSAIVLEAGGDEDQAVAALLHDTAEDHGGRARLAQLDASFGPRVASIVEACSDALPADGEEKAPWWVRKARYLDQLEALPDDAVVVAAADKLHNLRSTTSDHAVVGEDLWARFNDTIEEAGLTRRDGQLWYHRRVVEALAPRLRQTGRDGLAGDLERAWADLWTAVALQGKVDGAELEARFGQAERHAATRLAQG